MIRVARQPEPDKFDKEVRRPGGRFLRANSTPSGKDFRKNAYWRKAAKDLYVSYRKICAYTGGYLQPLGSIDHFLPKSRWPHLAYEWENLRLTSARMNGNKSNKVDVIDPFIVQWGWFALDFPSCLIRPGQPLSKIIAGQVKKTIHALKLNEDEYFVEQRCEIMLSFAEGELSLEFLKKSYPYVAEEIIRQGIQNTARQIFRRRKN